MGYVSNPGGGGSDPILEEDALAQADPITSYPEGYSIMRVTNAVDDWGDLSSDYAVIVTQRVGEVGFQTAQSDDTGGMSIRAWHQASTGISGSPKWSAWWYPVAA